jgi:hypothetical protein
MTNGSYCAPLECAVATVPRDMGVAEFLASSSAYANITVTQFALWNPSARIQVLGVNETVCIG